MMENKILDRWLVCRPAQTGGVGRVALADVPMLPYPTFAEGMRALLIEADGSFSETTRCVASFAVRAEQSGGLAFYALVAREAEADVLVAGHVLDYYHEGFPESLAKDIPALHVFEREIAELYGVHFSGAPWDKNCTKCTWDPSMPASSNPERSVSCATANGSSIWRSPWATSTAAWSR